MRFLRFKQHADGSDTIGFSRQEMKAARKLARQEAREERREARREERKEAKEARREEREDARKEAKEAQKKQDAADKDSINIKPHFDDVTTNPVQIMPAFPESAANPFSHYSLFKQAHSDVQDALADISPIYIIGMTVTAAGNVVFAPSSIVSTGHYNPEGQPAKISIALSAEQKEAVQDIVDTLNDALAQENSPYSYALRINDSGSMSLEPYPAGEPALSPSDKTDDPEDTPGAIFTEDSDPVSADLRMAAEKIINDSLPENSPYSFESYSNEDGDIIFEAHSGASIIKDATADKAVVYDALTTVNNAMAENDYPFNYSAGVSDEGEIIFTKQFTGETPEDDRPDDIEPITILPFELTGEKVTLSEDMTGEVGGDGYEDMLEKPTFEYVKTFGEPEMVSCYGICNVDASILRIEPISEFE